MRQTITLTYPGTPQAVSVMLADPDYYRARLEPLHLADPQVTVDEQDGDLTAVVSGHVAQQAVPAGARRFVRSGLDVVVRQRWQAPEPDGARTGELTVEVAGAPVSARARTRLAPSGTAATTVTVDLDLTVSVPLIGRSLESRALGMSERLVAVEERLAGRWLAEHPA